MIIKGCSRGSPKQLAYHLQRVDTNERVSILEIQHPVADLEDAFFCWQTLSEGSRGKKGLYHANIDPAEQYDLTPEQQLRAVDVLEEKLGFQGQSRVVVLHEKHGRAHLHVVWCRMDYDTGTLRSDSQNYLKHEQASMQLELEFGHELVPGKHAKRDREKQAEFPRAEVDHAEWQQAERTGINAAQRKEQVTALRAAADNAQAFKNALEEAGYLLAKGDKRGMVLVDGEGEVFSLSRHVTDIKGKEFKAFMAPIDQAALPTVEEAKALHKQREEETAVKAEKPGPEASKFLQPEGPAKVEEPAPAQPPSKFLPEQPSGYDLAYYSPEKVAERASKFLPPAARETPAPVVAPQQAPEPAPAQPASKFLPEKETVQPLPTAEKPAVIDITLYAPAPIPPKAPAPKPKREWEDREIYDLRQATWKRQVREYQEFADQNGREYKQQGVALDNANVWKMEDFDLRQRAALHDMQDRLNPEPRKGFRGVLDAIKRTINPQDDDAITAAKQEEIALLKGGQAQERREYIKVLEENKRIELEKLRERHLAQQAERERSYNDEIERRVAELKEARRIAKELEAGQREKDLKREGPEPPEEGKA